jgi:hypothetical protein
MNKEEILTISDLRNMYTNNRVALNLKSNFIYLTLSPDKDTEIPLYAKFLPYIEGLDNVTEYKVFLEGVVFVENPNSTVTMKIFPVSLCRFTGITRDDLVLFLNSLLTTSTELERAQAVALPIKLLYIVKNSRAQINPNILVSYQETVPEFDLTFIVPQPGILCFCRR